RIVLTCAEGGSNTAVAAKLGVSRDMEAKRMVERLCREGVMVGRVGRHDEVLNIPPWSTCASIFSVGSAVSGSGVVRHTP
ncbi:hypothetical protein MOQ72_36575, partial [Saccharopolyspora sp. K220]|uniref:hypothetical protein n=1 Tax=Saccharopolyspora soli TaxID=2926618 RepID=UPI001F5A1D3B